MWRTRLRGSGVGTKYSGEAQPHRLRRRRLHRHGRRRRVRDRRRERRDSLVVRGEARRRQRRRLLRLDEPRRRARRRQGVRRPARRQARRARPEDRQGRLVGAGRALAGRAHDHERAALLRRPRDHGLRGRRVRHPRPRQSVRRAKRQARLDVLHDSRPRRVRPRHVAAGQRPLAARRRVGLADAGRRSRARTHLLLDGQPGPRLQRRRARRRQPVLGVDRRARREDRQVPLALPAGASRHLGLRRPEPRRAVRPRVERRRCAKASRSRARRAGSTSSTARTARR